MLDISFVRQNTDLIKQILEKRNKDPKLVDTFLSLDLERKEILQNLEEVRRERNVLSRNFKQDSDKEKAAALKEKEKALEEKLSSIEPEFNATLYKIPNVVSSDTPEGKTDADNVLIRKHGEPTKFTFTPKDHLEIGQNLGIIDTETAAKVTGSRFNYLKGDGALLEFALINHTLALLTNKDALGAKPFTPVVPPIMIRPEVFTKMARLDDSNKEERYHIPSDNLYLIGSAEHTLGPMHMDTILNEDDLPIRYVGFSVSLRREAGSWGKDTKGILRVHQFDKLEIESFSLPEESLKEQDFIVSIQEKLVQSLGLPYQVVAVCTGDMGDPDFRQIDIETWIPSQDKYRETHSADLMNDYQTRRLGTKVKRKNGKTDFVHTNDATVFAIGRTIIAILENYQNQDGSVTIPEVLRKYMGEREKITSNA